MIWPDNIIADRHEVSGKWCLQYLTDEQAKKCRDALAEPRFINVGNGHAMPVFDETNKEKKENE